MRYERKGGVLIVYLEESDEPPEVREAENAAEDDELTKIVVDCRNVDALSSAMVGALVLLNKRALQNGLPILALRCVPSNILEVFIITRLHRIFEFED